MPITRTMQVQEAPEPTSTFPPVGKHGSSLSRLDRVLVVAAILGPVLYALIINIDVLDAPPAWDSAVTVSPAALTIVEHDFDLWKVAQMPGSPEGGPSTHATSIYTIGLAILIALLDPATAFAAAHLMSVALVAGLSMATYLLTRERTSARVSALTALAIGIIPVVVQQAADVYLDLPLAVIATLACWTTTRRWFWWTAGLALLAVAVKTSGVFVIPLLLMARSPDTPLRRHVARSAGAGLIASTPFLIALATTHRFAMGTRDITDLTLIRSSAALLVLTVDVFAVMAVYTVVIYGRARSKGLDRISQVSLISVAGFFAVHVATMLLSGTIAILPRYYIAILPVVLAALVPPEEATSDAWSTRYVVGAVLVGVLCVFSLVNVEGDFYPLPDHDFYVAAERSTRAQDLLRLHVLGAQRLVATDLPLLVERQVFFRLEYPGMGYVDETPEDMTAVFIESMSALPDQFAMLIERRYTNPLVPIEEAAVSLGYELTYEVLKVGPYLSQLVVASK